MIISKKINPHNLAQIFFLFFVISLFFPIRYVFPTSESYITGLYSDFTTFSLYLSDIFLFIAFFFILWHIKLDLFKKLFSNHYSLPTFLFWLILAIFLFNPHITALNFWSFFKFFELIIVAYGTTKLVFSDERLAFRNTFFLTFISLGTIQSIIGPNRTLFRLYFFFPIFNRCISIYCFFLYFMVY
jgi:hypothetical protein